MKNVEILYTPEEVTSKVNSLWKTDLFRREAQNPDSIIAKTVQRGAQYPLFFYDMSDVLSASTPDNEKAEWAHFTAWMGGIGRRTYDNDYIADLALLHELYHKGTMPYSADMDHEAFKRKMFDNELEASLTTELEIYFRYPELREHTFSQEIYADRFLRDEQFMQRWQQDPERMRDFIREKRRDAMYHGDKGDTVQYWIQKFAVQNESWANVWSERFNDMETAMAKLHHSIDMGGDRHKAMDEYMAWLQSPEITEGTEIPFFPEAEAFAAIARLNKRNYAKAVANNDLPYGSLKRYLAETHPGADPSALLTGKLAEEIFGPIPPYSDREDYQLTNVTTSTQGAFCVPYHQPEIRGVKRGGVEGVEVVLLERDETGPNGEPRYGVPGGYLRLKAKEGAAGNVGEQPRDGAARKFGEEVCKETGKAVLDVDSSRLEHILEGIDYKEELPVGYNGYVVSLSKDEIETIRQHGKGGVEDMDSNTPHFFVLPLKEALDMPKESFTHPHEFDALEKLASHLRQRSVQSGHTL